MINKKTTKRALLTSVLALVLCVSMLIGSTFAWFTDSVTSGTNKIVAGNLDVELEYKKVVDGVATEWTTVKDKTDIFNPDALWEPGRVEVVYLKVTNLGSLALKYQLGVNVSKETPGINVNDEPFKLSDHLVFTTVEMPDALTTYTDREATQVAAGSEKGLKDYNGKTTTLESKGEDYVALIVYMPESVGNEANYKTGTTVPTIELGVNLFATQVEAESDSFGNDYDEDAWHPEMKVYSLEDLQNRINAGETNIVLMNDILITEETVLDTTSSALPAAIVINHGNPVTLDLNGHSIVMEAKGTEQTTLLFVHDTDVTIKGEGVLEQQGLDNSYTIWAKGASTVTIESGKFVSNTADKMGIMLYASGNTAWDPNDDYATINVYGGEFISASTGDPQYYANVMNHGVGKINYYGGTFSWNPADDVQADDRAHIKVADGYKAVANTDGTYNVVMKQETLEDKLVAGGTVNLPAGNYTFPASSFVKGATLICAPGTVFEGTSKLNINGATVVGATFSNPTGTAADQTINGTFKDCTFTGSNGLRWCYAGETVVFENCVFDGEVYGIHFDGGANDVIFRNCTISGFNATASAISKITFEGCTFKPGRSGYNGINLWGNTEMIDCTFVFDNTKTEWVDLVGSNKTATFTNCVVTDGEFEKGIETVVGNYGTGNAIVINGERVYIASENAVLADAVTSGATKVLLTDGEYDLKGNQKDGLTLIGAGNDVKVANTTRFASGKAVGAITKAMNLKNVTITNTVYTMESGGKATFTNVYFAAGFRQGYGTGVEFTDCTFGSNSEGYALHFQTDSASEGGKITLNDCKFEGGKVHLGGKRAYEFTNCDFAAGTDFQVWSNITLKNCTVNGEEVTTANVATFFPKLDLAKVTIE